MTLDELNQIVGRSHHGANCVEVQEDDFKALVDAIAEVQEDDFKALVDAIAETARVSRGPLLPLQGSAWKLFWTGGDPPDLSEGGDWWLVAVNGSGGCLWAKRREPKP